jgi:N-acylneuraminate cytidylyltransferase
MKALCIIPARAGSKGIPGKNHKSLMGKPLIQYSLETALELFPPEHICISTDSPEIIEIAKKLGVMPPFVRPEHLATDQSGSREVLLHALDFYNNECLKRNEPKFDSILLLQPTSPLRRISDVKSCMDLYDQTLPDMVVSVCESPFNPYYNIFIENNEGFIKRSIESNYTRRQDCPTAYIINGSIYAINAQSLTDQPMHEMRHITKMVQPWEMMIDLDTLEDWKELEFKLQSGYYSHLLHDK